MNPECFLALQNGDLDTIRNLHRRVLHGSTLSGNTALHIAAGEGHFNIVQWFVDNVKGMCGRRNMYGNTALHEAAKGGNPDIVRILLGRNKRCAAKHNHFGETPLLIACQYGHVEAAKLLVDATPYYRIIWPTKNRQTCLHVAAYGGHLDVVRLLLAKKDGIWQYATKLLLSKTNGILEAFWGPAFKILSRFPDESPLHRAVHGGHVCIVREILNSPMRDKLMQGMDGFGMCAVHVAVVLGRLDIIDYFLLSFPSCVEIVSEDYKNALHYAVEYNRFEVAQKLLFGRKVENAALLVSCNHDISGNTALHLAAINGVNPQLVQYLISFRGVRVNALNNEGQTALDIATSQEKPNGVRIVEVLKDAEAGGSYIPHSNVNSEDCSVENRNGRSVERKLVEVDTLVASLISTVTFAAIFQIPGGIESDPGHVQFGAAKLALDNIFKVFLFSDTLALFNSLAVVVMWLFRERGELHREGMRQLENTSQLCLGVSLISTGVAFISATTLVVIPRNFLTLKTEKPKIFKEYAAILNGVEITPIYLTSLVLFDLAVPWVLAYCVYARKKIRLRLRKQLKWVLVYTLGIIVITYSTMPSWRFSESIYV